MPTRPPRRAPRRRQPDQRPTTQPLAGPGPVPEPALLYTPAEAARFLRLSPRSLERWRVDGEGPRFVKMGRRVVYEGRDLLAYVARVKARTDSGAAA